MMQWFSAADLAEAGLPGLSRSKRKINVIAEQQRWALAKAADGSPLARPRQARGGGLEYHISLLPPAAAIALQRRAEAADAPAPKPAEATGESWAWLDRQSAAVKAEAARRLAAIDRVAMFEGAGATRTVAVATAAGEIGVGTATLWGWLSLVAGVAACDRLPALAPRRQGGGCEAAIDERLWQVFASDYLRPEKPTMASAYRRAGGFAQAHGLALPHLKTFQRQLARRVDGRVVIARREGEEALRRSMPAQKRSVAELQALELVNIDGHKWDVFVRWPDGRVGRPMMVAVQDVYSRKFLAWRIGESESAELTRLCLADLCGKFGIPKGIVLDNGRAFASKQITGGAKTRFRFKIKDEDPAGVLTALGVEIHWAQPYRGQSKPIERGFRDFCDAIARQPAFAGAWTGNTVDAKPENYASKAVPLDLFVAGVAQGIAEHNARPGRRTETARGRSFDATFAESYGAAIIRKATPEQLRLALTAAEQVTVDRATGHVTLFGNRYWSEQLGALAGQRVTVRFDPADLSREIHVYTAKGAFLATVPILEQSGFLDVDAAKARKRLESDRKKAVRRAEELAGLLDAEALAALLPAYEDEFDAPSPAIVRPVRARHSAAALKPVEQALQPSPAFIDRFVAAERRASLRLVE